MKLNQEIDNLEDHDDSASQGSDSVEDFIRELEEKEKDLHITADLAIEIEDVDFEEPNIPDFIANDLANNKEPTKSVTPQTAPATDKRFKDEITSLKRQIEDLKKERSQILEKSNARLREFENFKKRLERERRETFVDQVCNLAKLMLPVMDNLERALMVAREIPDEKNVEFRQFFEGIGLVSHQINDILERMGVQPVMSVGEQFDPHYHEAVEMVPSNEFPQNTIVEELLRGYSVGERIIRHSMVKVVSESAAARPEVDSGRSAEVSDLNTSAPLPAMDEEVEEFITSSYADSSEPSSTDK